MPLQSRLQVICCTQIDCHCNHVCRSYVAQRLTASFRSHTAVSPHDWQTYEEMRSLALDKHHLRLGAIDLPTQASDQSKAVWALPIDLHTQKLLTRLRLFGLSP